MREPVRYLTANSRLPISVIPNAGLPINVDGEAVYPMEPEPFATELREFVVEFGVNVVGGCCGTTPEHIQALVEAVGAPAADSAPRRLTSDADARAARSAAVPLRQEPRAAPDRRAGQRAGQPQGQAAAARADDYDALLDSRARAGGGRRARARRLRRADRARATRPSRCARSVKKLAIGVEAPLVIDSTEATVVEAALETYPGRAIVNSINLENGRGRVDAVLPLVKEHGAAVVALTIDEAGHGEDGRAEGSRIARRIHDIAVDEYGLPPEDLLFDALTFTARRPATRSCADSRRRDDRGHPPASRRELPGVFTILGVSNVSFGVAPARARRR